ncbi:MAG TPA: hypothetical protein VFS43_39115 [Polyangiaceae bacterium]|nr:hypothetical protein [Polyangiaceae bacterium]
MRRIPSHVRPLLAALGAAALGACTSAFDGRVNDELYCRGRPTDLACGGAGGAVGGGGGGGSGTGGRGGGGTGGRGGAAGAGGQGGGGAGGSGPCPDDAACGAGVGPGSLCVGGACTKAGDCDRAALVVVDAAFAGATDPALAGACFFRGLGDTEGALVDGTTRSIVVYASALHLTLPFRLRPGVALEGRGPDGAPVALDFATPSDQALLTLERDTAVRGFALAGGGVARGIAAVEGQATLRGPLSIAETRVALDLSAGAAALVEGAQASPVRLARNAVGVRVPDGAALTLEGDGAAGGLVLEETSEGAGVLVLAGNAAAPVRLAGLLARNNLGSSAEGTGAVEVRRGRQVEVVGGVFEGNARALNLNGEDVSTFDSFSGVTIAGNAFTNRPSLSVLICGTGLPTAARLSMGSGNSFDGVPVVDSASCQQVEDQQTPSCEQGGALGYTGGSALLDPVCEALPAPAPGAADAARGRRADR